MDLAIVPHSGVWSESSVVQEGRQFLDPLIARVVAPHEGPLKSGWGFLEISTPNVVVSDVTAARDRGIVVRVYESAGKAASQVHLKLSAPVTGAREVNLLEDPGKTLTVQDQGVRFDLHAYEIKTLLLQLAPGSSQ